MRESEGERGRVRESEGGSSERWAKDMRGEGGHHMDRCGMTILARPRGRGRGMGYGTLSGRYRCKEWSDSGEPSNQTDFRMK